MKKKVKDLTIAECMKICSKRKNCHNCPIYKICFNAHNPENYGEVVEQEIEVEEDENN